MTSSSLLQTLRGWIVSHTFAGIAVLLAVASCFAVPPDGEYLDYIDYRTIVALTCMLTAIAALERVHVFTIAAEHLVTRLRSRRSLITGLVLLTGIGSMAISNDMALLTFLPIAARALKITGDERYLAYVFTLQAAAANLGGMIMPFGNPQNIFIYQTYEMSFGEFVSTMALPFSVALVVLTVMALSVRSSRVVPLPPATTGDRTRTLLYGLGFALAVLVAVRVLPVWVGLAVVALLILSDVAIAAGIDYGLLITFVSFFIITGNIARIDAISTTVTSMVEGNTLIAAVLASQVISNVPSAILLSGFTENWRELLVGVNVGGVGTLIASLANLIALRQFQVHSSHGMGRFLVLFLAVNLGLLILLTALMWVVWS
ncbi:SLC13 family permease [Nesterenkonia alba]|uniref:SLC13 family permease n=1 Tax=Nesterenkonia alba TaxID=515814 RepID=UPI0003F7DECC|nr:SLC13 family permease [Nesterenkonia alba]